MGAISRGPDGPAWSQTLACADAPCTGTGRSHDRPFGNCRRSASGRRGAAADDARSREVRLCHSSWEADEQCGPDRSGAGGAKGGGQGECEPAKHAPDTVPGTRVTGAGGRTASARSAFRRHPPKVGAVCPNWARTDLCGGREGTRVPDGVITQGSGNRRPRPIRMRPRRRSERRNAGLAGPEREEETDVLALRPNCECCDKSLPPDARDAMICTFECTFCCDCVETRLGNRCPNCGGNF